MLQRLHLSRLTKSSNQRRSLIMVKTFCTDKTGTRIAVYVFAFKSIIPFKERRSSIFGLTSKKFVTHFVNKVRGKDSMAISERETVSAGVSPVRPGFWGVRTLGWRRLRVKRASTRALRALFHCVLLECCRVLFSASNIYGGSELRKARCTSTGGRIMSLLGNI